MGQLDFTENMHAVPSKGGIANNGSITFFPQNIWDNISLLTVNLAFSYGQSLTQSVSLGLYSLTGSTLSLTNSLSATHSFSTSAGGFVSFSNTSATSNLTPGTWFWGLLVSTGGNNSVSYWGNSTADLNALNAFPGGFIGGKMTVSTSALPATVATSDLSTSNDGLHVPYILLTAV